MYGELTTFNCNDDCGTYMSVRQFRYEVRVEIAGTHNVLFLNRKKAKQLRLLLEQFTKSAEETE